MENSPYPGRQHPLLHLPSPLPTDITPNASSPQSTLYPPTGVIDSISMISICLRRPEHVPRAYQIFKQLLDDSANKLRPPPDAEVWARVIEGVAALGKQSEGTAWENWRKRAERLVMQWQGAHGDFAAKQPIGLEHGGMKVYQGWFNGLISSQSSLDPLVPYLSNTSSSLPVSTLLEGLDPSAVPLACEALIETAKQHDMADLEDAVRDFQGLEKARREEIAREIIEEVKPVLESAGKSKKAEGSKLSPEARFAITNLRSTLSPISTSLLPLNRQHKLEEASLQAARAELEESAKKIQNAQDNPTLQRSRLQGWMHDWLGLLTTELEKRISVMQAEQALIPADKINNSPTRYSAHTKMKRDVLLMYLQLLPVDKLALITILELMRMSGSGGIADGMKALRGMLAVGKAVETEFRAETIKNVAGIDSHHWLRTIDPQTQKPSRQLVGSVWRRIGEKIKSGESIESTSTGTTHEDLQQVWTPAWSQMAQLGVGSELVDALLKVAKVQRTARNPITGEEITEEQAAFTHAYEYIRGKKLGVIKLNPVVAARLARDDVGVVIHPKHLPMLIEPKPWTSHQDGGYLLHNVPIMRFKESAEQRSYLKQASKAGHLEPVFHGLDVLSSTPWAINRKVFDVVLTAWNNGDAIADIPASEEKSTYDIPEKPDSRDQDPLKRSVYVEKMKMVMGQQRKDHAERCKFNYNIEIARSYLNDTFYLPHNMDFRGRAYPIPPHLSPVGDDLCRGLLTFGSKKPLGEAGLKWLYIHLANVHGFDKASFEERRRFSQEHEAEIFDSADHPLDGNRWWLKAEDPWQCLATCFEIASALRSPDPTLYESSLPIHQDGTCNGMQHYAALGGDVRGAKAVNLENGDKPADIYTGVVDIVNKVIEEDQRKGLEVALLIKKPLGRKVVKQTVMTTVYGVTYVGAREQIAKQLQARGDFSQEHVFLVSGYIAKTVLNCIGDLFSGAKAIMDWLTQSAKLISRSVPPERVHEAANNLTTTMRSGKVKSRATKEFMTSVVWTTPLGLPVVQPYRKAQKKQIMTALQTVYISDPNAPSEVSPQKQATAFPPNFIHSLDATHMLLTALKCRQNDIAFASVHDSYWTHASTVEPMSDMIRETFIHLHSQDLVGELRQEFVERYGDHRIPVSSAKNISTTAARKKEAALIRQKQMSAVLGDLAEGEGEDTNTSADAESGIELGAEDEFDERTKDIEADIISSSAEEVESKAAASMGISVDKLTSDLEASASASATTDAAQGQVQDKGKDGKVKLRTEKIGKTNWVKFEDVLPPCPPRGVFNVDRVRESAYFFS
uniref:DNA-directed RNA polymerase n=1 Tax=Kwoniella dejecticola CBS 10117 TaxID=1296121 RepID=A0A1A6ACW5_9TREE|nr:DNA-directed RNA polymerase, mitochondrial [Kwoniella dejecticola CBS 10117]OBR87912.1 DNA-directed RNA polymerase, mitochondrial [Kwoniella dejecticola CBS 10117]